MKTIYKYPLNMADIQQLKLPKDAHILDIQMQGAQACLWALVDSDKESEMRSISIIGTGNPVPDNIEAHNYLGTFQMSGGALIWHAFIDYL